MKIKKVLVPTDFSENSLAALKFANHFIDHYGSCIDLIHVVPFGKYFVDSFEKLGLPLDMDSDVYPKVMSEAHDELERIASEHIRREYRGHMHACVDRKIWQAVCDYANRGDYDLILMSNKGAHESDFLRGGIAEKVIRHSKVPVLTVDQSAHETGFTNIMVPVDLSDLSFSAIPITFELARYFGAKMTFFHTVEMYASDIDGVAFAGPYTTTDAAYGTLMNRMDSYFAEHENLNLFLKRTGVKFEDHLVWSDGTDSYTIPVTTAVVQGISAHFEITEYANENADLLVMTTHGRTGLAKLFLGSTAGQVVQHTEIPVLTIKPESMHNQVTNENHEEEHAQ